MMEDGRGKRGDGRWLMKIDPNCSNVVGIFYYLIVTLKVVYFNIEGDINKRRKETE